MACLSAGNHRAPLERNRLVLTLCRSPRRRRSTERRGSRCDRGLRAIDASRPRSALGPSGNPPEANGGCRRVMPRRFLSTRRSEVSGPGATSCAMTPRCSSALSASATRDPGTAFGLPFCGQSPCASRKEPPRPHPLPKTPGGVDHRSSVAHGGIGGFEQSTHPDPGAHSDLPGILQRRTVVARRIEGQMLSLGHVSPMRWLPISTPVKCCRVSRRSLRLRPPAGGFPEGPRARCGRQKVTPRRAGERAGPGRRREGRGRPR